MKSSLLIIILYIAFAAGAAARGTVKISGLVTDEKNEPLEFVTVKAGKTIGTTTRSLTE